MSEHGLKREYTIEELDAIFSNRKLREEYEERERIRRDYISDMADARAEGRAEGIVESLIQAKQEATLNTVRECIKMGFDTSTICQITKLKPETIDALRFIY